MAGADPIVAVDVRDDRLRVAAVLGATLWLMLLQRMLCRRAFVPFLAEQYARGEFPADELGRVYKVQDYEEAFADVREGKVIKAVLD
ncbi:uncharacterized protein BO97DRAFT_446576 [Aspergillus homomorphus CBS 101889]|uniref:Alcohol dehydrogenase-like C-terminal domain-containing protein n=1 Tax=Aspergillus homomorphus (strain CBS 101889) TaxID=1450537 RepID=A0A395HLQ7_ASPHC|nr:hypothetical protein BO97DRAFT_446576 [Aspergillus homomorphus CBS 101889]RAL07808.1 hypothetical protein BO97DRAFT_446576 [Aspergillus homomorphus CBS 101889]